jgi:hypothetical protein
VYVKKSFNVNVVAVTVTTDKTVVLNGLTLTGQAQVAGSGCWFGEQCAREAFATRVTSVSVFDGAYQVGYARAPNPTTGAVMIDNMNVVLEAGMSKTFTVKASLSSKATTSPYDKIALGVAEYWDAVVMDPDTGSVLTDVQSDVRAQLGAAPSVVQWIRSSGELLIAADGHPPAQIVIGGKDSWTPIAQYTASAMYEAIDIDREAFSLVTWPGMKADPADYAALAVAVDGRTLGMSVMRADGVLDVDLSLNPIHVPKDGAVTFQIWAKFSSVQASSTVGGKDVGVCRSGHAPAIMLDSDRTDGEWDASYAGHVNARSVGQTSGEHVFVPGAIRHGNPMTIRSSMPFVIKQSLPSTTLANTDQDLIKFQVAADSAGSVALKRLTFQVNKTGVFAVSSLRLRRGSVDVDLSQYSLGNAAFPHIGLDVPTYPSVTLTLQFTDEEVVSGSGAIYTLHGVVSGATSGCGLQTRLVAEDSMTASFTGGLTLDRGVFSLVDSSGGWHSGLFIWSDRSEVPHVAMLPSSIDWTNGLLVRDLDLVQFLSL